jgi:hypothetical protein
VILANPSEGQSAVRATLDDLFRRALARHPDALALADPPDRATITDGPPRRLTYAQADRAITALAGRLRGFGLPADAVVALQLPNTVESVIALIAVIRAGLIAAPLPLLWREQEAAEALGRAGARALISCRTIGAVDYGTLAMRLAAETFAIRFVAAFGDAPPDGIVPLDDIFAAPVPEPSELSEPVRRGDAADHVAVVTFDVTPDGIVPVARSHSELIAGGLAAHLEARIEPDATILGAIALSSFAALASTVVPWLLAGGALLLHHPFAPASFAKQAAEAPRAFVLPGPLVARLAEAGLIGTDDRAPAILALWRAPERLAGGTAAPARTTMVDVAVFGEVGLIAARRDADGKPCALPVGRIMAPRGAADGMHVLDVARGVNGTIVLSGPMVPGAAFPPGAARADQAALAAGGIDTGYPCRLAREAGTLTVDGPPGGMVSVGGYRFSLCALQDLVEGMGDGALAALPDMLAGQRLAGAGADRDAICDALAAQGANPLLVAAFRARGSGGRATAA